MRYLKGQEEQEAIKWMEKAFEVAKMSLCHKAKCGTVIVKDREIIGEGFNAPPLNSEENRTCDQEFIPGKLKYDKTCCMHAEWRSILDAVKRNSEKIKESRIYFNRVDSDGKMRKSGNPCCTVCSRMALDVGITKFILWHEQGICEYSTDEFDKLSYQYIPAKK